MMQLQKKKNLARIMSLILLICLLFSNTTLIRADAESTESVSTEAESIAEEAEEEILSVPESVPAESTAAESESTEEESASGSAETTAGTTAETAEEEEEILLMGAGDGESDEDNEDEESTGDDEIPDLTQYISRITFLDKDGNILDLDTYTFKDGEEIQIGFNWTIPGEVYAEHKVYTYQLPKVIAIEDAVTGPVMRGSERVGTFRIDEDLKVTITYYDTYNQENNTTTNVMTIKGNAVYLPSDSDEEKEFSYKDGSETIVVVNDGDFTVEKEGSVSYENNQLSDDSTINYTVKIASSLGTYGDFTVTDTLTKSGNVESAVYDANSFVIKDADGNTVTGWTLEISESGFEITGLPALPYNGTYTLTYDVDVSLKEGTNTQETVKNKVTAKNEKTQHSYEKTITYNYKVVKSFFSYNRRKQQVDWHVDLYTYGTDMTGFVITDENDYPILPETVKLVAYNSAWQAQETYTIENGLEVTFSDDNKTMIVTVPDADESVKANTAIWQLAYKSQLTFPEGVTSVTTTNKAVITTPGDDPEKWEVSKSGVGTDNGTADLTKTAKGMDDRDTEADYITASWGMDISYSGISENYVSIYDKLAGAGYYLNRTYYNSWDSTTFAGDHYAIASELMEQFLDPENGLIITVINDDETTQDLTLAEAIAQNYRISFSFYQTDNYTQSTS